MQTHLVHVYMTLAAALAICAAGVATDAALQLAGWLATAGLFGCSMALALTPSERNTLTKRYALLAGAAFCQVRHSIGRLLRSRSICFVGVLPSVVT